MSTGKGLGNKSMEEINKYGLKRWGLFAIVVLFAFCTVTSFSGFMQARESLDGFYQVMGFVNFGVELVTTVFGIITFIKSGTDDAKHWYDKE